MAKYSSVNGAWPEGTNDGRDIKPTPQEAITGAKRLYRVAMGKPWKKPVKLTSGRNYTYPRRGVLYVNPDQDGTGGWHEIVHGMSHWACSVLHPNASGHGHQHAFIERELIKAVVNGGWLEGKLKRPEKAKADPVEVRKQRAATNLARWKAKLKRAQNAIRKLERQARYYDRKAAA